MERKNTQDLYFNSSQTLEDWTGGGYYNRIFKIELFGFKFVLWRRIES